MRTISTAKRQSEKDPSTADATLRKGRSSPKRASPSRKLARRRNSAALDGEEEEEEHHSAPAVKHLSKESAHVKRLPSGHLPEMALLPFFITKGNFEEAERTVRIALGRQSVDEGPGLKMLLLLMSYQAEMYKAMGLWPLSLAIYLDCAGP